MLQYQNHLMSQQKSKYNQSTNIKNETKKFNAPVSPAINNTQKRQVLHLSSHQKLNTTHNNQQKLSIMALKRPKESMTEQQLLTFGKVDKIQYKASTERLIGLLQNLSESVEQTHSERTFIKDTIKNFGRDLQELFDKYINCFKSFNLSWEKKEKLNKTVILYIDQTLKKEFLEISDKMANLILEGNSHSPYRSSIKKQGDLFPNALIKRQEIKNNRNTFSKIESSFNEVNKLLQRVNQPRFIRTGVINQRRSRESSLSFEGVEQKSLQQKKKAHLNNSNSKQTIHSIHKLLNQ